MCLEVRTMTNPPDVLLSSNVVDMAPQAGRSPFPPGMSADKWYPLFGESTDLEPNDEELDI
jgi:hypothetical protein